MKRARPTVMANASQNASNQKTNPLQETGVLPMQQSQGQTEERYRQGLPKHNNGCFLITGQCFGDQERCSKKRCRRQHHQVVAAARARHLRSDDDDDSRKTDQRCYPAIAPHGFTQKPRRANHDENWPGETDGRHICQRNFGQCNKPQHHPNGMNPASPKLAFDICWPIVARPRFEYPRQHHE